MLGLNLNTSSSTLNSIANSAIDDVLSGGATPMQSLSNVANSLLAPYTSILGVVGLGGAFEKTFGAILSNGFDVTCFNSASNPTKAKSELEKYHLPYFNGLMSNLQNGDEASVNRFIKEVYIGHHCAVKQLGARKWAKCTAKALELHVKFFEPLKKKADELIPAFIQSGSIKKTVRFATTLNVNGQNVEGNDGNNSIDVPQLSFSKFIATPTIEPSIVSVPKIPVNLSELGTNSVAQTMIKAGFTPPSFDYDQGELNNVIAEKKSPKKEGSFPWWILLGLGFI